MTKGVVQCRWLLPRMLLMEADIWSPSACLSPTNLRYFLVTDTTNSEQETTEEPLQSRHDSAVKDVRDSLTWAPSHHHDIRCRPNQQTVFLSDAGKRLGQHAVPLKQPPWTLKPSWHSLANTSVVKSKIWGLVMKNASNRSLRSVRSGYAAC